jgi:hypothetical protein
MRRTLDYFNPAGPQKRPAFSGYRHIPNYVKSMELVEAERDKMLDLVLKVSGCDATRDRVVAEIARNAAGMCVSFDEALYLRWRYCRDQQEARERIAALRARIGAGGA